MNKAVADIFTKALTNTVAQGRCILKLKTLYQKSNQLRFREAFLNCCLQCTKFDYKKNNKEVERCLEFAAAFCGNCYGLEDVDEMDQFVVDVIDNILLYHNNNQINFRYYACKIVRLSVNQMNARLKDDSCNRIQEAMLQRMNDVSSAVREQAVLAVMRFQQPEIPNCPVLRTFIDSISSERNASVRKVLVQKVALTNKSLPAIFASIGSADAVVRSAAYLRCAAQEPRVLEISQRQQLVVQIAFDEHIPNRSILERKLWPKWLDLNQDAAVKAAPKTNSNTEKVQSAETRVVIPDVCLIMLHLLLLDEDDDQLVQTYLAFKVVLKVHFKITPITDLIRAIKLDSKKLVPMELLTIESAFYWKYLLKHVQKLESLEEYSDEIVAELAGFCEYIDKYIKETLLEIPFHDYTWLSKQHILLQLLEMIACCDLNDDFGRDKLKQLLLYILNNVKRIHEDVLNIMVHLYGTIETNFETVCEHICGIMTDIIRPYKIIPLHDSIKQERDFKLAKLKFTLAIAEDSHATAMDVQDYIRAGEVNAEINDLKNQIAAIPNDAQLLAEHELQQQLIQQNGRRQRQEPRKDVPSQLRCCELLCALLRTCNRRGIKIPPVLYTAKMELVDVFLEVRNDELFAKTLEAIMHYGLMDKDIADIAIGNMSSPIIAYRLIPHYNESTLIAALVGFTSFLEKYGVQILNDEERNLNDNHSISQVSKQNHLERVSCLADLTQANLDYISIEEHQNIILDMLDDENLTITLHAALCISTLLQNNLAVNSTIVTRLILKWFTPELYDTNPKMLFLLSKGISQIGEAKITNIGNIMEESAMCVLQNVIEAPLKSSLYACNLPKCLQFLATITMLAEPNQSEVHRNLAQKIIPLLSSDIDFRSKEIYSKFLSYLDAPLFDMVAARQFEELLENTNTDDHKIMRSNIAKYVSKLRNINTGNSTDTLAASTQATISINSRANLSVSITEQTNPQLSRISEESTSTPMPASEPLLNGFENPVCSTPISKSRSSQEIPYNDKQMEVSYHISDTETDSQEAVVSDAGRSPDSDIHQNIVTSPINSGPNSNNSNDKPSRRQGVTPNKRVHDAEDKSSSQDNGYLDLTPHSKRSRLQVKPKLSLIIPTSTNEMTQPDTVLANLAEMRIESASSSQDSGSSSSSSSRKRGRPAKHAKENNVARDRRFSKRLSASSADENNGAVITVNAQIHHAMSESTSSDSETASQSLNNQSRKRPRLQHARSSAADNRVQINCKTRKKNGITNEVSSKLQSIENDLDTIDIVASSSETNKVMEFTRRIRRTTNKNN